MRKVAGSENRRKLLEAILFPDEMPEAPSVDLLVGERNAPVDLGPERIGMTINSTSDSGAQVMDVEIADVRPRESVNAPVVANLRMNGGSMRVFTGRARRPNLGRTTTGLIAGSAGTWRERIILGEPIAYEGQPEALIRRVVEKVVYYDRSKIVVNEIGGYIKRGGAGREDTGFEPENTVAEVLARVQEETLCVYRDVGDAGFEALPDPGLGAIGEPVWNYEALKSQGWETTVPDDALYAMVVVEKKPEPPPEEGKPGDPGWRRMANVTHTRLASPPPPGSVYWQTVTDDNATRGPDNGKNLADRLAAKLGREVFGFSLSVFLNPFLQLYDPIAVGQDLPGQRYKQTGTWHYDWACIIRGVQEDYKSLSSVFTGDATIRRETFTPDPPIALKGASAQVLRTPTLVHVTLRTGFPTPISVLRRGPALQEFRVLVRKSGAGVDPTCSIRLYEGGVLRDTILTTAVSSATGTVLSAKWDASVLSDGSGAGVECEVVGTSNQVGTVLEIGAIEWNTTL